MQLVTGTFKVLLHLRLKKKPLQLHPTTPAPATLLYTRIAECRSGYGLVQSSNIFADLVVDSFNKQILNQKKHLARNNSIDGDFC